MTTQFARSAVLSVIIPAFLLPLARAGKPYITTQSPLTLLSANDGEIIEKLDNKGMFDESKKVEDSVTVIHLGPNNPPESRTVYNIAPNSIIGAPYLTMASDGNLGFIANHGFRIEDDPVDENTNFATFSDDRQNVLTVIDLTSFNVVDQVKLPSLAFMDVRHFGRDQIIVSCGREFRVYAIDGTKLKLRFTAKSPAFVVAYDINPQRDRIIALGYEAAFGKRRTSNPPFCN